MARPWQLDIKLHCSQCRAAMDVTVELRRPTGADTKALCPYCHAPLVQEHAPGSILSTGKRE